MTPQVIVALSSSNSESRLYSLVVKHPTPGEDVAGQELFDSVDRGQLLGDRRQQRAQRGGVAG